MQKIMEEKDVLQLLRKEVAKAGGQAAWSRKNGIQRTIINRVLAGGLPLSKPIIKALNLKTVYLYANKNSAGRKAESRG